MPPQANQSSNIPPPPPGYTLDTQSGSIPPPPPGYKLDQAASAPAQQPEQPGFFKRLGQSLGVPTSMDELQAAGQDAMTPQWADLLGPGGRLIKGAAKQAYGAVKDAALEAKEAGENIGSGQPVGQNLGKMGFAGTKGFLNALPFVGPAVQTAGEDIAQNNYAGATGGLTGAIGQVVAPELATKLPPNSLLGRMLLLGKTPEGAYESALKPSTTIPAAKRAGLAQTALQEGIPVSQNGLNKLGELIGKVNDQISQKIASDPNKPISTSQALQNTADLKANGPFGNQVNPRADLGAIDASAQEFQDVYGNQMPAAQAQAVKQGTYKALSNKYGELGSASTEAQKALARGLKEELATQFPELNDLNARDSRLINLQDSLERAVNRIGNHQLLGIGTPMAAGAARAVTGSGKLGAIAGVMKAVLDNPAVKSNLAIALSQGKIPSPMVVPKIAAYAGALGKLSQPGSLPFLPQSGASPSQSGTQKTQ